MVFIRDLKREFFEFISKQQRRLLVFVHLDVDSLCAWKILQHLLQCEHITYTCLPVLYKYDLENGHMQHLNSGIKSILFINCGSTLDLYEFLSLDSIDNNNQSDENALTLFVLDSLRPIEHRNVYDAKQIRLLILPNKIDFEKKRVPDYEELFHEIYDDENEDDDDDENENDDDDDDDSSLRIETNEGRERRLKRQWLKRRDRALANYYKYRTHSYSSALIMFELAYLLSKDTNEQLWYSIIGVTEQILHGRIDHDFYMEQLNILQTHVLRLNHHQNSIRSSTRFDENISPINQTNSKLSMDCIQIKFDEDIHLHLLRHWSLYESICHTQNFIITFKLWSSHGLQQLKEFLADLGVPRREYEQNYRDMNINHKTNLKKQILNQRLQDKYHYTNQTILLPTFLLSSGFTLRLSPLDIVSSMMSTLQTASNTTSTSIMIDLTERFSLALSCLNYHQLKDYLHGIELEKIFLNKTHYLIESLLRSDKNLSFDNTIPFILLRFDQNMFNSSTTNEHSNTSSCGFFTHPYQAYLFARNALEILVSSTTVQKKKKSKHFQRLPLILIAPYSLTNSGQELIEIVVGVPALNNLMMNSFSTIFEAADRRCGNVAKFVFFDHSVLLLQEQHQQRFTDALMFVLAK